MIIIIIIIIMIMIIIILISWGEGSSLALAGNASRDGVSIKILIKILPYSQPSVIMSDLCLVMR